MKKWLPVLIVALLLILAGIYIFIPSSITVSAISRVNCTADGTFRSICDKKLWADWQSGNNDKYTIDRLLYHTIYVTIHHEKSEIKSIIQLLPLPQDSSAVQWNCIISTSGNPVTRIQQYQEAAVIKNNMNQLLNNVRAFVEKTENVYGIHVERTTFRDTLLMSTKSTFTNYPTTKQVYPLIASIKNHIKERGAMQTGSPMLNVTPLSANQFQVMVALPVNKVMEDNGPFLFRRMIPGSFMTAKVKGGPNTIREALRQMQVYFSDHRKTAMAIPFEYLVTDREATPDSSQWVTRIFAPVY